MSCGLWDITMDMEHLKTQFQDATRQCTSALVGHPTQTMAEQLQSLAQYAMKFSARDVYGSGALIRDLELRVATLFNMPDALYLPSGTLAQPIALKLWSEEKGSTRFAMHGTCHIELHEQQGYKALYGLDAVLIGSIDRVPTVIDLEAIDGKIAAIVLELPMREIGGQLPSWQELVAMSDWARSRDIAFHLDGARIWQCTAYFNRPIHDIVALFDSVYVSLYKDVGAISGALLLASPEFIAKATVWARRAGGNVVTAYPSLLSAHKGLDENVGALSGASEAAQWLAAWCNQQPNTHTVPTQPHTTMFHLFIDVSPEVVLSRCIQWMAQHNVALLPMVRPYATGCKFEINLGWNIQAQERAWWVSKLENLWELLLSPE
jgi:threonine aldolase